jgi:hypothetical protein
VVIAKLDFKKAEACVTGAKPWFKHQHWGKM